MTTDTAHPDVAAIREWASTLSLGGQGTLTVRHVNALCDRVEAVEAALREANDVLRSAHSIAARRGHEVNWEAFDRWLGKVLERQHRMMYPGQYEPDALLSTGREPT